MASNKQFAQNFLKDTPSSVKGILVIALIGGVGFGVYKIYQYFKKCHSKYSFGKGGGYNH